MWPAKRNMVMRAHSATPGRPITPPEDDCFPGTDIDARTSPPASRDPQDGQSSSPEPKPASQPATSAAISSQDEDAPELSGRHVKGVLAQDGTTWIPDPRPLTPRSSGILPDDGLPQFPYTPESIRPHKSHAVGPLSPLPAMPWNTSDSCSSPMQEALISCASNLESLILSREPTDEQMEYLISKFEEIARFLSAPDSQSKQSDDHLFSEPEAPSPEPEAPSDAPKSSIASAGTTHDRVQAYDVALSQGYVLEVEKYVEGIKRHVQDYKMRLDEVKQLNSIQLDIIDDLRRDLKDKTTRLKKEKDQAAQRRGVVKKALPQGTGFWSAIGEALDALAEMLHEW